MKIIFAGTTEFGIPTLDKLKQIYNISLVITQPDKPVGRKQVITPPPIKIWAGKNNIPVLQPEKISQIKSELEQLQPDLLLVAAYGQIIPKTILDIPKFGSINIHGSILPKYRGASPIQAAILRGDGSTGITLLKMDEQMDHGPIVAMARLDIMADQDFESLYKQLSLLSADLTAQTLPKYFANQIKPHEQNHEQATFTSLLTKQDARLKWTQPAKEIHQKILALNPEPGTWTTLDGKSVKILKTQLRNDNKIELAGKIYKTDGEAAVKCADASLILKQVQPEGKTPMSGKDFLNGLKNLETKIFV